MTRFWSFLQRMVRMKGSNTRLIDRAERLNERQAQLIDETGNYLRDSFYGVRRVGDDGR